MQNLLNQFSTKSGRGRSHGGFGFAPQPLVSRSQATYGALGLAAAILLVAGAASLMSMTSDDTPVAAQTEAAPAEIAATAEAPPASAPIEQAVASAAAIAAAAPAQPATGEPPAPPRETSSAPAESDARWTSPTGPALAPAFEAQGLSPDPSATAAIGYQPEVSRAVVPVAETDAEIAALEEVQQEENAEIISTIQEENGNAFNSPVMGEARVTQYVNMRAGPSDDATVLLVVPADATIQTATDCNWCETVYEGQRGFIYKTFIRRDG